MPEDLTHRVALMVLPASTLQGREAETMVRAHRHLGARDQRHSGR
jgi:hypothetical protein